MEKRLPLLLLLLLLLIHVVRLPAQTVTGTVSGSTDGAPLPGVSVLVKGTTVGTSTDSDGRYAIDVTGPESVLVFSFIGFKAQEVEAGRRTVIDVVLEEDITQLGEVVVTALGISREKRALGYSVTQVDGDDFTQARAVNLGNALAGKVAGVNVTPVASGAGGSSRVVIRGGSSLGGNDQPLYVINGVPIDNSQLGEAGLWGGSDYGDGLSSINPDDIESISVLKGNTAAALYGARAANGVILITTKSGKARAGLGIDFNSNFVMDRIINRYDWQTQYGHGNRGAKPTTDDEALEYGSNSWGAGLDGSQVIQFDGASRPYSYRGDAFDKFYRTGTTFTNTVSFNGGNEDRSFRFSASNMENNDVVPNSGMNRKQFSANTNGKFGKWVVLQANAQYSKEEVKNRPRLSDAPGNGNYSVALLPPSIDVEDLKGTTGKPGAAADGTELRHQGSVFSQNPYWAAYQFHNLSKRDRLIGSALARINITDWLYVQGRTGMDWYTFRTEEWEPYGTAYRTAGQLWERETRVRETNLDGMIGVNKRFGDINVDAFFGGNKMERRYERTSIGGIELVIPFYHAVTNVKNQSYTYEVIRSGINSSYGQVEVSYRDYLFLTMTGRNDWFSTLSPDNNSIFYPSVGASFVFSDAFVMPEVLSFGKLRASWAQVGGGAPDPYALDLTYSLVGQGHADQVIGKVTQTSIPNEKLQPLLSTETEIGIDLRFLQGRVGVDLAVYSRKTLDDILETSISNSSGFATTTINIGELSNKGIELLLTGAPVRSVDGLNWEVSFNMAYNRSEILSVGLDAEGNPIDFVNVDQARTMQEWVRHYVGEPAGVIAGYRYMRIDGRLVYDDDGLPVRDGSQVVILGNGVQPFNAGLRNTFRYRNFDMSVLIDMRAGGDMYSGTNVYGYRTGLHKETLQGREEGLAISGVDADGNALSVNVDAADLQDYYLEYSRITEYFVYDASFAKLRQLTLGYNFPGSMLSKTPLQSLNLSFVARNLILLWSNVPNVDPESAYNNGRAQGLEYFAVPATRSFGFNLSASF